jgi:hypothetical protein
MNRTLFLLTALGTSVAAHAAQGTQWVAVKGAYTQFENHSQVKDQVGYGIGYGGWCTDHFGVDLTLLRTQLKSNIVTATGTGYQHQFLGSLLFNFFPEGERVSPYFAVGMGATETPGMFSDSHRQTIRANYHAGLGAQFRLGENWSLTLDSKYVRTTATQVRNDWVNTVGIGVAWGRTGWFW